VGEGAGREVTETLPAPRERTDTLPLELPERTLGYHAAAWMVDNLVQPNGPRAGQPFIPTDRQIEFLAHFYALNHKGSFVYRQGIRRLSKGSGKANDLRHKILTTDGWKTIGTLREGDYVFHPSGKPTRVTQLHPVGQWDTWEVELSDGTVLTATGEHLFTVDEFVGSAKRKRRTLDVRAMAREGGVNLPPPHGWLGLPIILGTFMGAVGFPVILDIMGRRRRPRTWSLHTKLTLTTYLALTVASTIAIATFEWNNPLTYGSLPTSGKIMTALVNGVNARSSGLSTIPPEHMHEATWFLQDALMFVGGGSASTAGGIKVTTFAVLLLAILAEARGDQDIEAFGRRITPSTVRLSVAVAFIGSSIIGLATLLLLQMTNLSLDRILFEVISAFATVGLSTGITPSLPDGAKYVIVALMFVGRVGTMTAASALALRERRRVIRMPEASPMSG